MQSEADGLHKILYDTIQQCDVEVRSDLFQNIILTGGSMMFPGTLERMEKEISALVPASQKIKVLDNSVDDRLFAVWAGGSILANLGPFK